MTHHPEPEYDPGDLSDAPERWTIFAVALVMMVPSCLAIRSLTVLGRAEIVGCLVMAIGVSAVWTAWLCRSPYPR